MYVVTLNCKVNSFSRSRDRRRPFLCLWVFAIPVTEFDEFYEGIRTSTG